MERFIKTSLVLLAIASVVYWTNFVLHPPQIGCRYHRVEAGERPSAPPTPRDVDHRDKPTVSPPVTLRINAGVLEIVFKITIRLTD